MIVSQPNANEAKLPSAISAAFPNDNLLISNNVWLVASPEPILEVSKKIGVADGTNGAAVITEVAGYQGRANPNIWNWIKSKWEATANGKAS